MQTPGLPACLPIPTSAALEEQGVQAAMGVGMVLGWSKHGCSRWRGDHLACLEHTWVILGLILHCFGFPMPEPHLPQGSPLGSGPDFPVECL